MKFLHFCPLERKMDKIPHFCPLHLIVVKLEGGLGNQMFQYAYAKALKEQGKTVKLDSSSYLKNKHHTGYELSKYHIKLEDFCYFHQFPHPELMRLYLRFLKLKKKFLTTVREHSLKFQPDLVNPKENSYLIGYYQNEKYFSHIRAQLLNDFKLAVPISDYSTQIASLIQQQKYPTAIHIRRGDYINAENINIHGFCGLEYYQNAKAFLAQKYTETELSYFVFSNDIEWCKTELNLPNAIYVDSPEFRNPQEDIYLMSLCQNHIIANSSFSWWGAWLCDKPNKLVIAPKRWFADDKLQQSQDIVCEDWIKL